MILKLNIAQTPKSGNLDEINGNLGILVFHYPGVMEIAPEIRNPDARNSEIHHFPDPTRSSLSDSQTKSQEMLQILGNPHFPIKSLKIWDPQDPNSLQSASQNPSPQKSWNPTRFLMKSMEILESGRRRQFFE